MRKILAAAVLSSIFFNASSQLTGYRLNFFQVFDNREYFTEYAFPQTIFGARIDAALEFSVDTIHKVTAGLNYMYEYGGAINDRLPLPTIYYEYSGSSLEMSFGAFPRHEKLGLPRVMLNDTLNYYRPNIEGALLRFKNSAWDITGFIDWTGRVSIDSREQFIIGLIPAITAGNFRFEPVFLMYHNARSYDPADPLPLQDNGLLSIRTLYNIPLATEAAKLEVFAGFLSTYNRFRPNDLSWSNGLYAGISAKYGIFGIDGEYYTGDPVNFVYGDPFYHAGNYGRIDIFVDPFRDSFVESNIGWSVHAVPGEGIYHSQQVLIRLMF